MNAITRDFVANEAVREQVPLLVGLMGPSGSGKTYSALRIARGVQEVSGGDIYFIDTEARRGLHYADQFKFKHVPFGAPFGSLDYLRAIEFCVKSGAGVIVIDSMSHEHEGPGGLLDAHEQELTRMAGDDYRKREAMKMLAWSKPKQARRRLLNGIVQMGVNLVFCFRAKETAKPVKVNGKTEVVPQGFVPIAGDEFVYEMTMCALLKPNARGVPTWKSELDGERQMMKLPGQFETMFSEPRPLDEDIGKALAQWAKGGAPRIRTVAEIAEEGREHARQGKAAFAAWWNAPEPKRNRDALKAHLAEFQALASAADAPPPPSDEDPFNAGSAGQPVDDLAIVLSDAIDQLRETNNRADAAALNDRMKTQFAGTPHTGAWATEYVQWQKTADKAGYH